MALGQPQIALAKGIGMVHQHFTLAENLNALENVMMGSEPLTALRRRTAIGREKLHQIMDQTGLRAPLDVPVGRLSVGERQRIEILKALYREVRILVLDEPTAVLTPQEADALFEGIHKMAADGRARSLPLSSTGELCPLVASDGDVRLGDGFLWLDPYGCDFGFAAGCAFAMPFDSASC